MTLLPACCNISNFPFTDNQSWACRPPSPQTHIPSPSIPNLIYWLLLPQKSQSYKYVPSTYADEQQDRLEVMSLTLRKLGLFVDV